MFKDLSYSFFFFFPSPILSGPPELIKKQIFPDSLVSQFVWQLESFFITVVSLTATSYWRGKYRRSSDSWKTSFECGWYNVRVVLRRHCAETKLKGYSSIWVATKQGPCVVKSSIASSWYAEMTEVNGVDISV